MDAQLWQRVSELFELGLDVEPAQRSAWILEQCGSNAELAAELGKLLNSDTDAETAAFLEKPIAPADDIALDPFASDETYTPGSRRFGPYRLLRLVGRGGMGEVHLAERADGVFEQRVALKLLPLPTPGLIQRFNQERQILARLEHPSIAHLLDGGIGEHSIPYFAMEYVEGRGVTDYVAEEKLEVRQTLQLFLHICDAVQYAHRNLVVHRDIKPSNILVGQDGIPKLLDFGIAKMLQTTDDAADKTATRVFTPDYAAPEQIRGAPTTTATDVYSLGVILYELLTGVKAYSLGRDTSLEHAILQVDPVAPSAATGDTLRFDARRSRQLRGDLDRIVLTALAKEPDRRYRSVEAFAADIDAYLDGRAVAARGDSAGYRLRKFVRRHRTAVAAAAIVIVALISATVISLGQAHRANVQAQRAEAVKDFLVSVFQVSSPDESKGETITARTLLDNGAERIERELDAQPELKVELTDLIGNLYSDLGVASKAEPLLQRAVALSAPAKENSTQHARALLDLSVTERGRGAYDQSLQHEHTALDEADALRDAILAAEIRHEIADTLESKGEFAQAETATRAALADDREIHGESSTQVASDLHNLGLVLNDLNRYAEAETVYEQALALARKLYGNEHTSVASVLNDFGVAMQDKGDLVRAEQLERESLEIHRRLEGEDHPQTLETENNLAAILDDEGKYDETIVTYRHLLEARKRLFGPQHPQVAVALNNLARAEHAHGDFKSAEGHLREAIAEWSATEGPQHPDTARGWRNLAAVLRDGGEYAQAETAARESLSIDRAHFPEASEQVAASLNSLGRTQRLQAHYDDALSSYRKSLDDLRDSQRGDSQYAALALAGIGETQLEAGHAREAASSLAESIALARHAFPDKNYQIADVLLVLGRNDHAVGDDTAGETALREALDMREKVFKPGDRRITEVKIALAECLKSLGHQEEANLLSNDALAALNGHDTPMDRTLVARANAVRSANTNTVKPKADSSGA